MRRTASGCCRRAATSPPIRASTDDIAAVADADVVFVALKAYSLTEIAPRLGEPARARRRGHLGAERHPVVVLPVAAGPRRGLTGLQSVDPGGVIAGSIRPEHNVGCVVYCSTEIVEPGVIRHVEGTRFTLGEPDGTDSRALPADLCRVRGRAACGRRSRPACATRSG